MTLHLLWELQYGCPLAVVVVVAVVVVTAAVGRLVACTAGNVGPEVVLSTHLAVLRQG